MPDLISMDFSTTSHSPSTTEGGRYAATLTAEARCKVASRVNVAAPLCGGRRNASIGSSSNMTNDGRATPLRRRLALSIVAVSLAAISCAAPAASADDNKPNDANDAIMEELTKGPDGRLAKQLSEQHGELVEQANAIPTSEDADAAGLALAVSDFDKALGHCEAAIKKNKNDAYAWYLKGIALALKHDYSPAFKAFQRVYKLDNSARQARLIGTYCKLMIGESESAETQTIVVAFDKAYEQTAEALNLKQEPPDLADVFGPQEFAVDPYGYKLILESVDGEGPMAPNADRLIDAALEMNDAYALWSLNAQGINGDSRIAERLKSPEFAKRAKQLNFLTEFFGVDKRYEENPKQMPDILRELQQDDSDEALWKILAIGYKPPTGEALTPVPLSKDELATLEQALMGSRFTLPGHQVEASFRRALRAAGFPLGATLVESGRVVPFNIMPFLNDIAHRRAGSTAIQAAAAGDSATANRALNCTRMFIQRLRAAAGTPQDARIDMICNSIEAQVAELEIATGSLPPGLVVDAHRIRVRALARDGYRPQFLGAWRASSMIPLPEVSDAFASLTDSKAESWELELAMEKANQPSAIEEAINSCKGHAKAKMTPSLRTLAQYGFLKQRDVLPAMLPMREYADGDKLFALIWLTGQLDDQDSIPWLIGLLDDSREWVPIIARESLVRLTKKNLGTDAKEWRGALNL